MKLAQIKQEIDQGDTAALYCAYEFGANYHLFLHSGADATYYIWAEMNAGSGIVIRSVPYATWQGVLGQHTPQIASSKWEIL